MKNKLSLLIAIITAIGCFINGGYIHAQVQPLLQTTWGQESIYELTLPGQSRFGCVGVAVAQLMRYYRHPVWGTGQSEPYKSLGINVPAVNFEKVFFDWDNTLNRYSGTNSGTPQQLKAINDIYYHVAIGIGMHLGPNGTGGSVSGPPLFKGLTTFFGFDKSMQRLNRSEFDDAAWEAIIREQLDAGMPVYYRGNNQNNTSDHTFIVDGYDNAGKFHVNWGWSGSRDGWFSLNELNPGSSDFRYNQAIIINLKPDEGGVSKNEMSLNAFSTDKTAVSQYELFTVNATLRSTGIFSSGGHVGAAFTDNNGNIIKILGMNTFNSLNMNSTRTVNINCYVPETINPGQYNLRIILRPQGEDWKIVTLSEIRNGVPNARNITVNPYKGAAPGGGYGIALVEFPRPDNTLPQSVRQNELFTLVVRTRTVSVEAFSGGQLGAALTDNAGNIVEVIGAGNYGSLNSGSSRNSTLNCYVSTAVTPGRYRLMTVVRPEGGNWSVITNAVGGVPNAVNFTVAQTRGILSDGYGQVLTNFSASTNSVSRGERFTVTFASRNNSIEIYPGGPQGAALIDDDGNIAAVIGSRNAGRLSLNQARTPPANINCTIPSTVKPGRYRLMIVMGKTGSEEWRIATISLPDIPASINFTVR